MKITMKQLLDFVYKLPTNVDYDSPAYGRISIEQDDMTDYLVEFLKAIDVEVTYE